MSRRISPGPFRCEQSVLGFEHQTAPGEAEFLSNGIEPGVLVGIRDGDPGSVRILAHARSASLNSISY
jgi:hypothetical protein